MAESLDSRDAIYSNEIHEIHVHLISIIYISIFYMPNLHE